MASEPGLIRSGARAAVNVLFAKIPSAGRIVPLAGVVPVLRLLTLTEPARREAPWPGADEVMTNVRRVADKRNRWKLSGAANRYASERTGNWTCHGECIRDRCRYCSTPD